MSAVIHVCVINFTVLIRHQSHGHYHLAKRRQRTPKVTDRIHTGKKYMIPNRQTGQTDTPTCTVHVLQTVSTYRHTYVYLSACLSVCLSVCLSAVKTTIFVIIQRLLTFNFFNFFANYRMKSDVEIEINNFSECRCCLLMLVQVYMICECDAWKAAYRVKIVALLRGLPTVSKRRCSTLYI